MNIIVNSQLFAHELRQLTKITPVKSPLPILSHILVRANDTLRLEATDLELALRTTCRGTIEAPGIVALPATRLLAMFEQFPSMDVTITCDQKHAKITCGAFTSRLQALPPHDFPTLPDPEGPSVELPGNSIRQLIARVHHAIPDRSVKFVVAGAELTLVKSLAAMAATDGKRVALSTIERPEGTDLKAIIPTNALDFLAAQEHDTVTITLGPRHLFFEMGSQLLTSRIFEAQFPNYRRIIPTNNTKKAIIPRWTLMASLKRVGLVTDQSQTTTFAFSPGILDVAASSSGVGDATERLSIEYTGDPLTVTTSWQYVVDFLEAATGSTITIELTDERGSMLCTDGENHLAVILLMRT